MGLYREVDRDDGQGTLTLDFAREIRFRPALHGLHAGVLPEPGYLARPPFERRI
jgi:hypothetical protein